MTAIKWARALLEIRKGKKVDCPDCGKAAIKAEYVEHEKDDGTVILSCPSCKKMVHFSHQKPL